MHKRATRASPLPIFRDPTLFQLHSSLTKLDHRPWELPSGPWTWRQSWCDLLFAHWPIPASMLRALVPKELKIQEYDGTSWLGVVPFRMEGVMRRPLPDLPWISAFPELNVRLYVERNGKPGVWFLSLDATNPLAVWAARRFFYLPYFRARMTCRANGAAIEYSSERAEGTPARFTAAYEPISEVYQSSPGTLEHFLTERYCLYARHPQGWIVCADVHHHPWPLQRAEAGITINEMPASHGLKIKGPPALLHFARRIDVVVWSPLIVGV